MLPVLLLSGFHAIAGVGDPVDGHPNWSERDLHLWTNAARVAPLSFPKDAEQGGCSTDDWAGQVPVAPLRWNDALGRVARAHSADMAQTGELSHHSSDGTSMVERIQAAYGDRKAFAENVARGYPEARMAVLSGWMCSPGHRKNLLEPRYDEVGLGAVDVWFTQDLGDGGWTPHRINAAVHHPQEPVDSVTFWTDVWHPDDVAPEWVQVVVDGEVVALEQAFGSDGQGVWRGTLAVDGRCRPWFVEAAWSDGVVRWPAGGSYGVGECDFDDVEAGWLALQLEPGEGPHDPDWRDPSSPEGNDESDSDGTDDPETPRLTNLCATSPTPAGGLLLLAAFGLTRRRVRGRPGSGTDRRAGPRTPPRR